MTRAHAHSRPVPHGFPLPVEPAATGSGGGAGAGAGALCVFHPPATIDLLARADPRYLHALGRTRAAPGERFWRLAEHLDAFGVTAAPDRLAPPAPDRHHRRGTRPSPAR